MTEFELKTLKERWFAFRFFTATMGWKDGVEQYRLHFGLDLKEAAMAKPPAENSYLQ